MARLEVRHEAELDALETMLWYEGERDGLGGEDAFPGARPSQPSCFDLEDAEVLCVLPWWWLQRD
jgi:hypothetical protein